MNLSPSWAPLCGVCMFLIYTTSKYLIVITLGLLAVSFSPLGYMYVPFRMCSCAFLHRVLVRGLVLLDLCCSCSCGQMRLHVTWLRTGLSEQQSDCRPAGIWWKTETEFEFITLLIQNVIMRKQRRSRIWSNDFKPNAHLSVHCAAVWLVKSNQDGRVKHKSLCRYTCVWVCANSVHACISVGKCLLFCLSRIMGPLGIN